MSQDHLSSFLVAGTSSEREISLAQFVHMLDLAQADGLIVLTQTPRGKTLSLAHAALLLNLPGDTSHILRHGFQLGDEVIDIDNLASHCPEDGFTIFEFYEYLSRFKPHRSLGSYLPFKVDPVASAIKTAKKELLRLWPLGFDALAPEGAIDELRIRELGIGSEVFAAMLDACGRAPPALLKREEFLDLAPKLIHFWPVNDQSLRNLYGLMHETRRAMIGTWSVIDNEAARSHLQ